MPSSVAETLRKATPEILSAVVSASARLALHLTGARAEQLPQSEVQRLRRILKDFIEALDAQVPF